MRGCSCHTRRDGREGPAWQCWREARGGQRSAMLVRGPYECQLADISRMESTGAFSQQTLAEDAPSLALGFHRAQMTI